MWKVLDEETVIPAMADTWANRMVELSKRRKDRDRFVRTLEEADVSYHFDPTREISTFVITLPSSFKKEDLEFMHAFVEKVNRSIKFPVVSYNGIAQRFTIVFTLEETQDDYAERRGYRSQYFNWVEEQAKKELEKRESF